MTLVSVQNPLRLDAFNELEPDLLLLRPRADDYRASHPSAADVLLLIEVADSSLAHDRGRKLALYAQFGLPEVWIVDLAGAAVEVYRQPKDGAYVSRERRTGGSLAGSCPGRRDRRRRAARVKPADAAAGPWRGVAEGRLLNALKNPLAAAEDALARLDERVRASPIQEGFVSRSHFQDACASLWLAGEIVVLEDLVLHDVRMDVRSPTHEVTRAQAVLRARRQTARAAPGWALSPDGLEILRGDADGGTAEANRAGAGDRGDDAPESHAADDPLAGELAALDRALESSAKLLSRDGARAIRSSMIPIGRAMRSWRPGGAPPSPRRRRSRPSWPRPCCGIAGKAIRRSSARPGSALCSSRRR